MISYQNISWLVFFIVNLQGYKKENLTLLACGKVVLEFSVSVQLLWLPPPIKVTSVKYVESDIINPKQIHLQ